MTSMTLYKRMLFEVSCAVLCHAISSLQQHALNGVNDVKECWTFRTVVNISIILRYLRQASIRNGSVV